MMDATKATEMAERAEAMLRDAEALALVELAEAIEEVVGGIPGHATTLTEEHTFFHRPPSWRVGLLYDVSARPVAHGQYERLHARLGPRTVELAVAPLLRACAARHHEVEDVELAFDDGKPVLSAAPIYVD